MLLMEFTVGELLAWYRRSAVPGANRGEKLPRPAHVPHLHGPGQLLDPGYARIKGLTFSLQAAPLPQYDFLQ
ncbi:MAG: hypothetical protein ABFS45_22450 [Pseudomonadota bacterium]